MPRSERQIGLNKPALYRADGGGQRGVLANIRALEVAALTAPALIPLEFDQVAINLMSCVSMHAELRSPC